MAKFLRTRGKSFLIYLAISELPLLLRNVWRDFQMESIKWKHVLLYSSPIFGEI